MYVGRIVAVGMNKLGDIAGMYRISSRSYPNRVTNLINDKISVIPKKGYEADLQKNPYITYNCIRVVNNYAVVTNGSHTDPIAEKIGMGYPARDALAAALLAMDFEKDEYNTPRIAGVINRASNTAWLATVRHDGLFVKSFELNPGELFYVATYEHCVPCKHYSDNAFDAMKPEDARKYIMDQGVFAGLVKPITSAAALSTGAGFELSAEIM